jgi:drug/metabolite transporter (DMT)-like permease
MSPAPTALEPESASIPAAATAPAPAEPLASAETRRWVPIAFLAVYIIWGSTYLGIRIAVESIPPFAMAAMRHTIVGLILYPILRWKTGIRPTAQNWVTAAVTGIGLLCIANGGLGWAEIRVPSGIAALLVGTISLWLVIIDWLRPGGKRPTSRVFAGLVLGFAGLALLVGPSNFGGQRTDPIGTVVLMICAFVWACASLYSKHRPAPSSPLLVVAMQSLTGGAALWITTFLTGEYRDLHFAAITTRSWLAVLYLITFGSGIGFTAYLYILRKSTPAKVSTYGFVNPVVALFLGWLFLNEQITTRTLLAATIIVTAVVLVIATPRAGTPQAAIPNTPNLK